MNRTVLSLKTYCLQAIADNIEWICWKGGIREEDVRKFTFFVGAFDHLTDSNIQELFQIFSCPWRKGSHLRAVHLYLILHTGIKDLDLGTCAGLVDSTLLKMLAKRKLPLKTANLSRLNRSVNSSSLCELLHVCGGRLRSLCLNKTWCVNDDVFAALAKSCPHLQRLHLASCTTKHLTMKSVQVLCNAPFAQELVLLDVSCTTFQPNAYAQFLCRLPSLVAFNMDMSTASASEVFAFIPDDHQCASLCDLVISNINTNDSVVQRLPTLCPRLRSLNIGGHGSLLTEDCLPALAKLSSLEELFLPSENFRASSESLTGLCLMPQCWPTLCVLDISFPRDSLPFSLDLLSDSCCQLEKLTVWHAELQHDPRHDHQHEVIFPNLHSLSLQITTFAPIILEHVVIMPEEQIVHFFSSLPASLCSFSVTHSNDLTDDILISCMGECRWVEHITSVDFSHAMHITVESLRVLLVACTCLRNLNCNQCWNVTQQNVIELRRASSALIEWD